MKSKPKGIKWERVVRDDLIKQGFFVTRQAASSFPDLISVDTKGTVLAIECKVKKEYLRRFEREDLLKLEENYHMTAFVAYPKYSSYSKKEGNVVLEHVSDNKKQE